jgi:hypothetical protein
MRALLSFITKEGELFLQRKASGLKPKPLLVSFVFQERKKKTRLVIVFALGFPNSLLPLSVITKVLVVFVFFSLCLNSSDALFQSPKREKQRDWQGCCVSVNRNVSEMML